MKNNWYSREVHRDSKGLFVFFGGCRFRPCKWSRKTRATLGSEVELNPAPYSELCTRRQFTFNHIGYVMVGGFRETWTIGEKNKLAIPDWYLKLEARWKSKK